jgi:hypothetical protein
MQGLVNLANFFGFMLAVLLPTFCYLTAIGLFLFAGWGFWMQSHPDNPFRSRPWVPAMSLALCGVCASFDQWLNKANVSAGTGIQVSLGSALGYAPNAATTSLLGNGPSDSVVNVVQMFLPLFQSFGAMACFFALIAWHGVMSGRSQRTLTGCAVQFVFGICLINVLPIAQTLVGFFQTGGTTTA